MNRQTAKVLAEALGVDRYLESSGKMLRHFVSNLECELRVLTEAAYDESETERIDVHVALQQLTKRVEAVGPLAEYLERVDPDASGHGGVLESVVDNALTDLKMLRTTCTVSDDRSLTSGELEHTLDGLIGRIEAGLEVARDIGREAKGVAK